MNQKGASALFIIIILVIAGLLFVFYQSGKLFPNAKTSSNSGDLYKDLKVGLRKAFEK